ncbi:MAG: UDP-N-acetylmuramoyl-L-alanine--D-glutamate ligase [Candidatus Omnitrophica bacterium]|nr:UDP-N-acetylmuramoyl-L-alanine--D-glutamate ligase [Candidatus Omnitrophota bacterium]
MDIKDKLVTVVGLGNSGLNAALLLKEYGADVRATDSQDTQSAKDAAKKLKLMGAEVEIGGHTEGFIKGSALVVLSPGVEDTSPAVKWADKYGIPIIGEMELGSGFCKGRIIAITGTNGKSTVTTLTGEMLKEGLKDVVVCGNIGNSLCGEIKKIRSDTWVVLEVSSFQLERIESFKPHIAIILNITDDHMDRYKKFSGYFNEKLKVFVNQDRGDYLILNNDADNLKNLKDKAGSKVLFYSRLNKDGGSAYLKGEKLFCRVQPGVEKEICSVKDIRLKGLHNIENVLASSLACMLAGVPESSIKKTISGFKGLSHRFETVDTINGVEYVDDSKGTTVDSTYRALESCEKPVILIAGGKDKFSDYSFVKNIVKKKVSDIVLIGEAAGRIKAALKSAARTHEAGDMFTAVEKASELAKEGSMVLLSPMCSSFDMFSSYKERGEVFKKAVARLKDPRIAAKSVR